MIQYDIVLLTQAKYVNPQTIDWYTEQILTEDRLVLEALGKKGLRVLKTNWDNPDFDWTSTRFALFRTIWDYFHRFEEFETWLKKVNLQTKLINSAEHLFWNIDKHYLLDLQKKGVNIPPSHFVEPQTQTTLKSLQTQLGWNEMVLKPAVSGCARHTYRLNQENLDEYEAIFQTLIAKEAVLLQPFLKNILTKGEIALMLVNGKVTHAVLKKAKEGDFRVQDDFGGTVHDYIPNQAEIAFAEKAFAACDEIPMYGRVDMVWDNDGEMAVSELELVDPEMWFRQNPNAAEQLADAIFLEVSRKK